MAPLTRSKSQALNTSNALSRISSNNPHSVQLAPIEPVTPGSPPAIPISPTNQDKLPVNPSVTTGSPPALQDPRETQDERPNCPLVQSPAVPRGMNVEDIDIEISLQLHMAQGLLEYEDITYAGTFGLALSQAFVHQPVKAWSACEFIYLQPLPGFFTNLPRISDYNTVSHVRRITVCRLDGATRSLSPDNHGWTEQVMWLGHGKSDVDADGKKFYAKRDARWFRRLPSIELVASQDCMDRQRAHVYIEHVLKVFQEDLSISDTDIEMTSLAFQLKVRRMLVVHQISGNVQDGSPGWWVCEEATNGEGDGLPRTLRLIEPTKFALRNFYDPIIWQDAVQAFLHFFFIHHDGKAVITELDCTEDGIITNLQYLDRRRIESRRFLRAVGSYRQQEFLKDVGLALRLFKIDHECNNLCRVMNLAPFV